MNKEKLEELQAELADLDADDIGEAISDGVCCETAADFVANMDSAIEAAELLIFGLRAIRSTARATKQSGLIVEQEVPDGSCD